MSLSDYRNKTIAVLMGGFSSEREVSLRSGENVYSALKNLGLNAVKIDAGRDVYQQLKDCKADIAFIALHGEAGEDGCIQGLLEFSGIPYTGSGVGESRLGMNKLLTKKILLASGLPVPDFVEFKPHFLEDSKRAVIERLGFPVVLKPVSEGSSIGVELIKSESDFLSMIDGYVEKYKHTFAEQYVKGKELTVGILGREPDLHVFPILELRPHNEFYDYEAKYTKGMTDFIIPAELSEECTRKVKDTAREVYSHLGLSGVARVDLMIDADENMYFLEANTIPGLTETSDIPAMAQAEGMSSEELMIKILDCVQVNE